MKVFFASCTGDASQQKRIEKVTTFIRGQQEMVGSYIYNPYRADNEADFSNVVDDILSSDVYIAEMSQPSQTLGFQIAFALNNGKPCLYLYDEETHGKPATPILGHPSRMLKVASYNDATLSKKLSAFYKMAKIQLSSKRTSFMSTRGIDVYLETESRRLGIPKAEVIRQALHRAAQHES